MTRRVHESLFVLGAALGLSLIACTPSGSSSTSQKTQPGEPKGGSLENEDTVTSTQHSDFRAASAADLQAPLQKAFEAARNKGQSSFAVTLAPGTYKGGSLTLRDGARDSALELIVAGEGPGPSVFEGMTVALAADRVELRNVVITGARSEAPSLDVKVGQLFTAKRVALVDNTRHEEAVPEPVFQLVAGYRSKSPAAEFIDGWFVGNRTAGDGALISIPKVGRGKFASVHFERTVFVANEVATGIAPWFTGGLGFEDCLIYETRSRGPWLTLASPITEVEVKGGVLALTGQPVDFRVSPDAGREMFKAVRVSDAQLRMTAPRDRNTFTPAGPSMQPAPAQPADLAAFKEPALRGEAPDIAALRALIR